MVKRPKTCCVSTGSLGGLPLDRRRRHERGRALPLFAESGQVAVLAAGAMLLIIGFAALAVDVGYLYATKRNMQTAADAAAIAGSNALEQSCGTAAGCTCSSVTACASAGADVAKLNGFTDGENATTVTVGTPATPPSNPASGTFVQATVQQAVPTFFLRALGYNTVNVAASAMAGYAPEGPCMTAVDPTDKQTIDVSGGASVATTCPIIDESSNSDGLNVSGGGTVSASSIALVASSWSGNGGGAVTPTPSTGTAIPPNPFSQLVPPSPCSSSGGCTGACAGFATLNVSSTPAQPINQGVYCGGIAVSGNSTTLTLNPGTYILVNQNGNLVSSGAMVGWPISAGSSSSASRWTTPLAPARNSARRVLPLPPLRRNRPVCSRLHAMTMASPPSRLARRY